MSPYIDTYYQESHDGAATWSTPLQVDKRPANFYYGAFSRDGLFEGDYNEVASGAKLVYIVRMVSLPTTTTEPPGLVYDPSSNAYVGNTSQCPKDSAGAPIVSSACLRHLHQNPQNCR